MSSDLDAKQCREVGSALEAAERGREPMETILGRAKAWARRTLRAQLTRLITFKKQKQLEQRWAGNIKAQEIRTRRLLIQLATRAYELERGERPKNLNDLVPGYLKAVPRDPSTEQDH